MGVLPSPSISNQLILETICSGEAYVVVYDVYPSRMNFPDAEISTGLFTVE
jgi:hypothetical protein